MQLRTLDRTVSVRSLPAAFAIRFTLFRRFSSTLLTALEWAVN